MLLALRHLFFHYFHRARFGERAVKWRQVISAGNQRRKPLHLTAKLFAFRNHAQDKGHLAAFTPQFLLLTAEVQRGVFSMTQVAALALAAARAAAAESWNGGLHIVAS